LHGFGSHVAVMIGWNIVAWNVKEIGGRVMTGNEALEMSALIEALHDPLSSPCRLMGIFRAIV
jgi:hypothetical protein